jgi:hypothetical protein
VNSVVFPDQVDVLYSIGTLQYLYPANREKQFRHFQQSTVPGGLHVLFAFVEHPHIEQAPDCLVHGNNAGRVADSCRLFMFTVIDRLLQQTNDVLIVTTVV